MRVLGIDPGSRACGFGVVEEADGAKQVFIDCGVIAPRSDLPLPEKLAVIYNGIADIIQRYAPQEAAVESVFTAKNARASLVLGHARGAAILAAVHRSLTVYEYTPMQVKQAVVGYGGAEKGQVAAMVRTILNLPPQKIRPDAADALACCVCHLNSYKLSRKLAGLRR